MARERRVGLGFPVVIGADAALRSGAILAFNLRKMIMMYKFLTVAVAVWIALLAGCHTMGGFGQDLERGGQSIQEKAKK